ncbi:LuxR C-terminal-related transcriptional regulator [Solirubrobacter soli]|uniref:LuxR C-terminal-related transcriptional regulator n=1 Tax=Solirubrobacter soli TaxID=363832 RepID=UPI00041603FC|nr:LuxR C-terminal-related transcriptional regulator [Solirubrobacter soli]
MARDELVTRLAESAPSKLALVCAPAGWGKTVLLAQWRVFAQEHRPFAWVSLDASDDEPVRFWSYVVAALRTIAPGFGGAVLATLPNTGSALVEAVLPQLINELAQLPVPVVLVLDDFHVVRDERVLESVAFLLRHLPRTAQLAITSRADPPLPLARLRAAGELVEVRAGELQFDGADADALLNGSLALGLGPGDVELLRRRTEGWPAGLQLAGLSLRERSDRSAFIRTLAGDDRQIGDYLAEVIEGAPRPMREFLLRTSILERMCASLCEAVTASGDAAFLLSEAFRSNLFVVALDDRGQWYRYHHLLRDLLRSELGRTEPDLVSELHARASAWHQREGDLDAAIVHGIASGQIDAASDLIARHWQKAWHVDPRTVSRWLDELPAGTIEADPRLCLIRGWTSMFLGRLDEVEPMIRLSEAGDRGAFEDDLGSLATKGALLRACVAYLSGEVGRAHEMAVLAESDGAPTAGALSGMLIGMTRYMRGESAEAIVPLERARGLIAGGPLRQLQVTTLGVLACAKAEAGDVTAADQFALEAEAVIDERGFTESPTASLARAARGMIREQRGDLEGAEAAYTRAAVLARRDGWRIDLAHALLLHANLRRRVKDVAGARSLAREARRALATCPDPGILDERVQGLERALQVSAPVRGPALAFDADLSDREIAVLRLLATDLSQREIGSELYVSFNTVKSHTRTLFRKLSVTSRAEAVARGRELGLI